MALYGSSYCNDGVCNTWACNSTHMALDNSSPGTIIKVSSMAIMIVVLKFI